MLAALNGIKLEINNDIWQIPQYLDYTTYKQSIGQRKKNLQGNYYFEMKENENMIYQNVWDAGNSTSGNIYHQTPILQKKKFRKSKICFQVKKL